MCYRDVPTDCCGDVSEVNISLLDMILDLNMIDMLVEATTTPPPPLASQAAFYFLSVLLVLLCFSSCCLLNLVFLILPRSRCYQLR